MTGGRGRVMVVQSSVGKSELFQEPAVHDLPRRLQERFREDGARDFVDRVANGDITCRGKHRVSDCGLGVHEQRMTSRDEQ